MKKTKKLVSLICTFALILTAASCGSNDIEPTREETEISVTETEETETTEPLKETEPAEETVIETVAETEETEETEAETETETVQIAQEDIDTIFDMLNWSYLRTNFYAEVTADVDGEALSDADKALLFEVYFRSAYQKDARIEVDDGGEYEVLYISYDDVRNIITELTGSCSDGAFEQALYCGEATSGEDGSGELVIDMGAYDWEGDYGGYLANLYLSSAGADGIIYRSDAFCEGYDYETGDVNLYYAGSFEFCFDSTTSANGTPHLSKITYTADRGDAGMLSAYSDVFSQIAMSSVDTLWTGDSATLYDLTGDGVPELIYISSESDPTLYVYTYFDGAAVELLSRVIDVNATAGGGKYAVYIDDDGNLNVYIYKSGEDGTGATVYEYKGSGNSLELISETNLGDDPEYYYSDARLDLCNMYYSYSSGGWADVTGGCTWLWLN